MEEQHSFDEFFRGSLADYRETPPPAAWNMVAQRLDDDDRRRRRGFFYWPWTVLSLLLLMGGAWWLYGWYNSRLVSLTAGQPVATQQVSAGITEQAGPLTHPLQQRGNSQSVSA